MQRTPRDVPSAIILCKESLTRDMVSMTLRAEGYRSRAVDELADAGPERPQLQVVDEASVVSLPDRPLAPTLVLLSGASPMTRHEAQELALENAGAGIPVEYLPFPFSPLELARSARRVRRTVRNRAHLPVGQSLELVANA